ncbi:MAG: hypothetical protein AB8B71_08870 [Paracoccaceae bacterium]
MSDPDLLLSCYYRDSEEKTRRASFLRFLATQCFADAAYDAEAREFLEELRARVVAELNRFTFPSAGGEKPLPAPDDVREVLFGCLEQNRRQFKDFDEARIRPVLRNFVSGFRAFRLAEHAPQAGLWQGYQEEVPSPNPVLARYLREIEPILDEVRRCYGYAITSDVSEGADDLDIDTAFDDAEDPLVFEEGYAPAASLHVQNAGDLRVHVNIALQPKSVRNGPVHGKLWKTDSCPRTNPPPTDAFDTDRVARVNIQLPDEPDKNAAFMVPYTVAHEVGIHALQQISGSQGIYPDRQQWQFSEGFMDAVIFDLVYAYLDADPEDPDAVKRKEAADFRHTSRRTRDVPSIAKGREPDWAQHLSTGGFAWKALKTLAREAYDAARINESDSRWATSVALKLNVLDLRSDRRAELLSAIQFLWGNRPRLADQAPGDLLAEPGLDDPVLPHETLFQSLHEIRTHEDFGYCKEVALTLIEVHRALQPPGLDY